MEAEFAQMRKVGHGETCPGLALAFSAHCLHHHLCPNSQAFQALFQQAWPEVEVLCQLADFAPRVVRVQLQLFTAATVRRAFASWRALL